MILRKIFAIAAAFIFLVTSHGFAAPSTAVGKTTAVFTVGFIFPAGAAVYPGLDFTLASFSLKERTVIGAGISARGQLAYVERKELWSMTAVGGGLFASVEMAYKNLLFFLTPGIGVSLFAFSGDPAHYSTRDTSEFGFAGF
ncbi:MAG: hypothetical protein HN368_23550, partial [Spirochaetales bacterium]|nr:hypothetical protein [Spirochaetales bacterium]